ncbi:metallophosphoesterase [Paracoccaceae bacterium Fryx2]|nr:metallophosphoesterase [Paracoccaceae bacterium Fryx2]
MRSYAIGDIHGHLDKLKSLHARIAADRAAIGDADAPIIHVGDLVDRGPDSCGVVEYLRAGIAAGENWVVLKGNHDRMFTLYLTDLKAHDPGLRPELGYLHPRIGGVTTLASYGVANAGERPLAPVLADAQAVVPASHRAFLETLPTSFRRGAAVFVHAGIRPGIPLERQSETDLVWIREPFLSDTRDHGALIVHGHTAIDRPTHYGNRLNLDSGAAYGGPLSAVVLEGREVFHLTETGRVPLRP